MLLKLGICNCAERKSLEHFTLKASKTNSCTQRQRFMYVKPEQDSQFIEKVPHCGNGVWSFFSINV